MLIPLKIKTDYSLLKSTIKMTDLFSFLNERKITVAGICDENLYGVMEFYNLCEINKIKPIIGLEIVVNEITLSLYAKDYSGYQNLLKLHTIQENREITIADLELFHHHLKAILSYEFINHFDEIHAVMADLYLGYYTEFEKNNSLLITDKIVFVNNIRSLKMEDTKYLDYLNMIEKGTTLENYEKQNYSKEYWNDSEVTKEEEETTENFCKDISIVIPKNNRYIPKFETGQENSYDYLVALSKKGLTRRLKGFVPEEYQSRLNFELETIAKMGFVDYFLIVYDYVFFAKKNGILVGPGRGSAAGSLVSYTLGITDVDPIQYQLLFERFLNPERISMPDIDIDFEYTRRNEVITYVKEKYGYDCVSGIMTFGTLGSKLVLRDLGKCLNLSNELINKFVNLVDPKKTLKENLENQAVKFYYDNREEVKNWYDIAFHLEGLKRHISTHAAGVVISSVPLDDVIPIAMSGGELLTGVTMAYLEDLGLLKMDFLALRNLTIIQNIIELIKKDKQIDINLSKIDLNDPKVISLFHHADTLGIFQFESTGMTHFLEKLKPDSFNDLVAALALFRPGPMHNIDSFIKRKEGRESVDYIHPDFEPILKDTYGIIIYQEQVMQILSLMGGFTFSEADNIRRAMSKKKKEVIMESKEKFIEGAKKKNYQEKTAEEVYDLILRFADYGFNKAHSVSYGLIGFQMAYLKVNYPIYYIANLLNMSMNVVSKTKEYLIEARKRGYILLKPDINESIDTYKIIDNSLILPFSIINNLGSESTVTIIKEREKNGSYKDFFDFVARTYGKSVNKKTIECLIDSGAFDSFYENKEVLKENIDSAMNYATLISDLDASYVLKPTLMDTGKESEKDDRLRELETFGFYLSNHPSSKFNGSWVVKLENISKYFDKHIKCVVVVENIKKIETKKKDTMAFLKASDETSDGDFVVFPTFMTLLNQLKKGDLILIEGKVTKRFDKYQINIVNITKQ